MRRIVFVLLAGCGASASPPAPPPPPSAATRVAHAPLARAAAREEKDWMWELVGGARKIWLRAPGEATCERWRLEPAGLPASYEGKLLLDAADASAGATVRYAGSPPTLTGPLVTSGADEAELACDEGEIGWYLSEEACESGAAAPIRARGCRGAFSSQARARAQRILAGELREALLARLVKTTRFWKGGTCEPTYVREGREPSFSGSTSGRGREVPSTLRNGKPVYLFVETRFDLYPQIVRPAPGSRIRVDEVGERNPHYRRDGEAIALGCCDSATLDVLEVTAERAVLRRRAPAGKPPPAPITWFFERTPCEAARR